MTLLVCLFNHGMLVALQVGSWLPTSTHSVRCDACTALAEMISAGQMSANWSIAVKRPVRACHHVTDATCIVKCRSEEVDISMTWSARVLSQGVLELRGCSACASALGRPATDNEQHCSELWHACSFCQLPVVIVERCSSCSEIVELAILAQPNSRARSQSPPRLFHIIRRSPFQRIRAHSPTLSLQNFRFLYCAFFRGLLFEKPMPYSYTSDPPKYALYMVTGRARAEEMSTFVVLGVKPICWLRVHQL